MGNERVSVPRMMSGRASLAPDRADTMAPPRVLSEQHVHPVVLSFVPARLAGSARIQR